MLRQNYRGRRRPTYTEVGSIDTFLPERLKLVMEVSGNGFLGKHAYLYGCAVHASGQTVRLYLQ